MPPKNKSKGSNPAFRRDKPTPLNKNGKKSDGPSGSSFFTWFMIIALLGVWTSVAVVWFDLVDYEDVLAKAKEFRYNLSEVLQGKLGIYDADGDGDFDMEDAKVLLGLTKGDGNNDQIDTLEEVLDTIAEETSDWAYGFFSFLFDVMTPFEILEDEENEASEDVAEKEPGGKLKAKDKAKAKGLKERAAPAASAGKTEEPVHHFVNVPVETAETQVEDSESEAEPLQASEIHEDLRSEPVEEAVEEEEEEEEEEELAELTEEGNEDEDIAAETADEIDQEEQETEPEVADIPPAEPEEVEEEPVTEHEEAAGEFKDEVEEETLPEPAEILEDSEEEVREVTDQAEAEIAGESEVEEEGADSEDDLDGAKLEPKEVVSEREESLGDYEIETETQAENDDSDQVEEEEEDSDQVDADLYNQMAQDFFDQEESEGETEEEVIVSDEYIEEYEPAEAEDATEEYYAEESEYVPGNEDIQEASPVPEKTDKDSQRAYGSQSLDLESEIQAAVPLPEPVEEVTKKDIDIPQTTEEHLTEEVTVEEHSEEHADHTEEHTDEKEHVDVEERIYDPEEHTDPEEHPEGSEPTEHDHSEDTGEAEETMTRDKTEPEKQLRDADSQEEPAVGTISPSKLEDKPLDKRSASEEKKEEKVPAKKKKPKLLNKFDKTIKAELDAAEKLRKKGKTEEALKAFNELLSKYPQSPRAKYGKGQSEDDLAEKMRSNEMLQKAINTYGEVVDMPNPTSDLVKLAVKRQANRQQFLGHIKRSVATLQKLTNRYPNDVSIKNELGVSYLLLGDNNSAKRTYEEVLALAPNDGFAKVHYGFILKAANQIAESIPYLKEGLESEDPGTDDGRFYFHLGDALQRVGDKNAYKWYELGHQRGHFASVWQRSLYNVNGLKAQPWWTTKEIGYADLVKTLERNWKTIRDEGLSVMNQEKGFFLPEDENLREKGNWGQFTLWQQGRKNENSCKHVPRTCTLLERFSESTGCKRGQIKYSIMQPGTHVWPHTGPTNCRLRMHLGLVIPKGCQIRCANDTREWKEGKVIIFDDSFEHEVWQDANSYRLIFIVDVWHPELTSQQRRTLSPI